MKKSLGNDLLSQGVAPQVPSALMSLTTGFEMWPGVPSSLQSPRDLIDNSYGSKKYVRQIQEVPSSPHHMEKPSTISTT